MGVGNLHGWICIDEGGFVLLSAQPFSSGLRIKSAMMCCRVVAFHHCVTVVT